MKRFDDRRFWSNTAWLCLLSWSVVGWLAAPQPPAMSQELSAKDQSRVTRLKQLSDALQAVKIDLKQSSGDRSQDGRRYSNSSELHMRFLTAAADLSENKQDGICTFPVQVSGFSSNISSAQGVSDQKTGSDLQRAKITLVGMIGQPKPKAKVDLAGLQHGSSFPADQIARDRIHDLIRQYFPEAEIDGKQRFFEKELVVHNETDEAIRVWVYGRSWDKSPDQKEGGELGRTEDEVKNETSDVAWRWLPGEPGSARPIELRIAAGQTEKVVYRGSPLAANRVLIWAEGESGERWWDHKREPLWLVEPNPKLNGERTYHAEQVASYTHSIKSRPGPRLLTERMLQMKNDTSEPLEVKLRYRTNSGNGFAWQETTFSLGPHETLQPTDGAGSRIRASRVQFVAESEHRKYTRYGAQPLWLVEETNGRRAYKADKIGEFLYTFQPAAQTTADLATVTASDAPIMSGRETLAVAGKNQKLKVLGTQGDWVKVEFDQNGTKKVGFVKKQNMALGGDTLQPAPERTEQKLQVTADRVEVKLGSATITELKRGDSYRVLEQKGQWYKIEVVVDSIPRMGWVQESAISVK